MTEKQLTDALHRLRWSQSDLARRLGVHVNTASAWATGKVEVPGYVVEYLRVVGLAKEAVG